jgi:triacylglycerol esterase/lipase EstA (alpha/beta hydrolase family)
MRIAGMIVSLAAAVSCLGGGIPAAAAAPADGPPQPGSSPPGANNWSCHRIPAHPEPVVLVHGLGANMSENWQFLSPRLAQEGYCVFALTYGVDPRATFPPFDQMGGVVPMEQSAVELSAFVDKVLAATRATKVDIVGHSEGSLMPDYYVKFLGGAAKVDRYVGLTPLWNGTNMLGLATMDQYGQPLGLTAPVKTGVEQFCGSCPEFLTGSPFIVKLNSGGGPAVPGVTYTDLMTRYDEAVVPYTSGNLPGATNIVVQDQCPSDVSEHAAMAYDGVVARDVLNALDPTHPLPVTCSALPPFTG